MKNLKIHYFASLKEQCGKESEELTTNFHNYRQLYNDLMGRYKFSLPDSLIQVAVDDEFIPIDSEIKNNAKVVFIPPVAGG